MSLRVGAGNLDHRVTVNVVDRNAVASGTRAPLKGSGVTVSESFSRWARRRNLRADEIRAAGTDQMSIAEVEFVLRYDARIKPSGQIVSGGTTFEIVSAEVDGRKQFVVCKTRAINKDVPV